MMRMTMLATVAAAAALLGAPAAAQVPLSVELRLDGGIPVADSGDELEPGVGFGIRAALDVTPSFALYGGYSRFEFEVDERILPGEAEVETDGFELGGRVGVESYRGSSDPYLFLGALFHETAAGDVETGLEVGLGTEYAVSWEMSITPEVRYRTVEGLDYLTLGLGARFRF